jgi:signal transduction histidine kinase
MLNEVIKDEKVYEDIKTYISTNETEDQENIFQTHDSEGAVRYYKLRYSSIILPENDINAALIVFSDITQYEELDRLKSEFVAKVSHELKTPLTSMGMAVGILGDEIVGNLSDKQKELILSMREDYNRLNKLVKEILELSRIESGGIQLEFKPTDIKMLLKGCIKTFSLQCEEKNIKLRYISNGDVPLISADYDYLSRAVGNFIGNSIKFIDKGGEINLSADSNDSNLVITIADNGPGINPEYLDKIFDKFVQVSGTKPGSVGLGLTIAKEIIELHHGSINVWSKPGQGSKFEITIPVQSNE